jgi:hypothetical protein
MISSTLSESASRPDIPFPCLMHSIQCKELVTLFSKDSIGTVVAVGEDEEIYFVGDHVTDWDMGQFVLYHGGVQLTNEQDIWVDEPGEAEADLAEVADREASLELARIMAGLIKAGAVTLVPAPPSANQTFGGYRG